MMIKRKIIIVFTCIIILCFSCFNCFAIQYHTYTDVNQNSSQAENLISLASNYDSFESSKFIVFSPAQYQYYIVWGDFQLNSYGQPQSDNVEYIRYIRDSSYNSSYYYEYGTESSFVIEADHIVVSNIDNYGMRSQIYEVYQYHKNFSDFVILISIILFLILLFKIRKG